MNKKAHVTVGISTAVAQYLYSTRNGDRPANLSQLLGVVAGGYAGAVAPDVLEPARSSWHRDVCHSFCAAAGIVKVTVEKVPEYVSGFVRPRIAALEARIRELGANSSEIFWLRLEKAFLEFLETFLPAFLVAYLSHLAVDSFSPRGLPLVSAKYLV